MPAVYMLLLLAIPLVIGFLAGLLLGREYPRKEPEKEVSAEEKGYVERRFRELHDELKTTQEELNRKREIAAQIPIVVRMLSEKLPQTFIPAIAVRSFKNFFNSEQVAFLALQEGSDEAVMLEGVGFPPGWKSRLRFSTREGILGMSVQNHVLVTRDEYASYGKPYPAGPHSLETAGVVADLVAPVIGDSKLIGAMVIAGSPVRVNDERHYASMLADIFAGAFRNALVIESTELSASVDPLTGLFNRMYLTSWFENAIRQARNYGAPLSVVLMDIDHFKNVNDTYGHAAGDVVLKRLGELLKRYTRNSNLTARYGGEEFVIVMTAADKEQACKCAEFIRDHVARLEIKVPDTDAVIRVTASLGVAAFPADGDSTTDLIRAADDALYKAKGEGRNKVVAAESLGLDGKPLR